MARRALSRGLIVALLGATVLVGATAAPAAAVTTSCRIVVTDLGGTLKIVYTARSSQPRRAYGVKIVVSGDRVYQHRLRTGDDGRLRVRVDVPDEPGREMVVGSARDVRTDDTCVARVLAPAV